MKHTNKIKYILSFSLIILLSVFLLPGNTKASPKFRRPVNTYSNNLFSAYYDNQTGGGKKSHYCHSYDTYNNHRGTDFRVRVGTNVYAAANGGVFYRYDNCSTYGYFGSDCGGGFGNNVRIDHEGNVMDGNGWRTIYAHLKKGTAIGNASIPCGRRIGKSGSSGNSTGPHLHFEVRKYGYPHNDPFAGTCSGPTSFWVWQGLGIPTTQCQ